MNDSGKKPRKKTNVPINKFTKKYNNRCRILILPLFSDDWQYNEIYFICFRITHFVEIYMTCGKAQTTPVKTLFMFFFFLNRGSEFHAQRTRIECHKRHVSICVGLSESRQRSRKFSRNVDLHQVYLALPFKRKCFKTVQVPASSAQLLFRKKNAKHMNTNEMKRNMSKNSNSPPFALPLW